MESQTAKQVASRSTAEAEWFDAAFLEVRPALLRICQSIVGDDASDIVQDVYVTGRAKLGQLREPEALKAWLAKIAVNRAYARNRRSQRLAQLLPRLGHPERVSDPDLRSQIEALPLRERTIVVLHYGHGLELEAIARLLDTKPTTVRGLLFRARARLKAALE